MAVSDSAKLDYLWKKVGYGVTKTAPPENKEAFNESIPSPLLYRGDLVMVDSGNIPVSIPLASSNIVQVYKDDSAGNLWSATVECTEDLGAPDNRTWKTNLQNWVPTQFGSTYLVKVYVANAAVTNPQTVGTQLFQAGSGNNDEWFFDYQSGVLNFNGANIPSQIGTGVTGKSIYISGARYVGEFGVSGSNSLGNLNISDTTITTSDANANITITPIGNGVLIIDTTTGLVLPTGNTVQRPANAITGTTRFNTTDNAIETWDGSAWIQSGGGTPGNYGNSNVAAYLPTYTGNLVALTGDVTTTANVIANNYSGNSANIVSVVVDSLVANSVTTAYGLVTVQSTANTIILGNANISVNETSWSSTTTNSLSTVTLFSIAANTVSSVDFAITATSGNNRQVSKILTVTINDQFNYTEYGSLNIGDLLGNFFIDVISGSVLLQVTPFTSNNIHYSVVYSYDNELNLGL